MYELTITRIKYPKNDSITLIYETLDNMLSSLKDMINEGKIKKDHIFRIEVKENEKCTTI